MVDARRVIRACESLEDACSESRAEAARASLAMLVEALDEFNFAIQRELAHLAASTSF